VKSRHASAAAAAIDRIDALRVSVNFAVLMTRSPYVLARVPERPVGLAASSIMRPTPRDNKWIWT